MKAFFVLSHSYSLDNAIPSFGFQPRQIAFLAAVLGCLWLGTTGARAQSASRMSCQSSAFSSAGTDACTVNLSGMAAAQIPVYLYSSDPSLSLPSVVYVTSGQSSATFSVSLASVTSARTVWITAQSSSDMTVKTSFGIQLSPSTATPPSPQASSISCQGSSFSSAGTDVCTVYLSSATRVPVKVYLTGSDPALTLPSEIPVPPGSLSNRFSVSLASVTTARTVWITAQANGTGNKPTFGIQLTPSTSAQTTPALKVNATSISFGLITLSTDAVQVVTLTSSGTAPVTIKSAVVTGSGFSLSGASFPVTLNPGQSMTLSVLFAPTLAGSATGLLTITSNSASNPTTTFQLSGSGASASHDVDLSWNAPAASTVQIVGYNVYRAPGGTSSFQRLNSSPVGSTSYTDSAVTAGQTYVYEVKSVDSAGVESTPSNSSTAVVP